MSELATFLSSEDAPNFLAFGTLCVAALVSIATPLVSLLTTQWQGSNAAKIAREGRVEGRRYDVYVELLVFLDSQRRWRFERRDREASADMRPPGDPVVTARVLACASDPVRAMYEAFARAIEEESVDFYEMINTDAPDRSSKIMARRQEMPGMIDRLVERIREELRVTRL